MLARRVVSLCVLLASFAIYTSFAAAPATAPVDAYQVDTQASRIFVKVGSATLIGHEHGVEARLRSGTLAFSGEGELAFDMSSFTADTPEARKRVGLKAEKSSDAKKVTQTMRGPEVLNVASFPTATFHMTAAKALGGQPAGAPGTYQLEGNLKLHGVDRKLQLKARLEGAQEEQRRLIGTFTLKQTDFGIKPYSMFAGMTKVADALEITGDLRLITPAK